MPVIDASVAAKWVLPEEGADRAAALRSTDEELTAPDLIIAEVGSAVWKRAVAKEISRSQAVRAVEIAARLLTQLVPIAELADRAITLAIDLRHPIYDCFYLALAQRENTAIVTADERLFAAARKARIQARLL
ncbi:MAG: type II toxin-antitoxin system VapC family toxin [Xanthobacteraceae bacterium]